MPQLFTIHCSLGQVLIYCILRSGSQIQVAMEFKRETMLQSVCKCENKIKLDYEMNAAVKCN